MATLGKFTELNQPKQPLKSTQIPDLLNAEAALVPSGAACALTLGTAAETVPTVKGGTYVHQGPANHFPGLKVRWD
ncbi:MAG: hypothetical protein R3220_07755 [Balneolaceae bacterium]|nr:hypothetical protein [Balneolaceae bacterium]